MTRLTIFSLPKGFVDPHITLIQRNALASWRDLGPDVEVLLMGDDPGVAETAQEFGVQHVGDPAKNEFGTPLLDWAFREAAARGSGEFLCYVNADIILLHDFLDAVTALPRTDHLAIGQRWNCDITRELDFGAEGAGLANWARENGTLDNGRGSDYFLYPRTTDFGLPPFAVGRPGWDNWMMGRTLELGLPLIDVTPVVTVIHQNHDYGHVAARRGSDWEGPEADRNRELGGWLDHYLHTPLNATALLTADGLRSPRSPAHLRAKLEAFVALEPRAVPLRRLVAMVRRLQGGSGQAEQAPAPSGDSPSLVHRITGSPALMPLTARVICARLVRESLTFFTRALLQTPDASFYHLRELGTTVAVRHTTQDGATLAEVFHRHDYEPGAQAARAIGEPGNILDLGANVGYFGAFAASRWPGSTIVGYEADPANARVHEQTIRENGLGRRWSVVSAAAGAHDGDVELADGLAMGSFVVAPGSDPGGSTIRIPMRDVMDQVSAADLVKLDTEGGEWEILADPRFAENPPRAIVLEYHPHLCPGPDPRAEAERLLAGAHMHAEDIWHRDDGYGMLWAWRD